MVEVNRDALFGQDVNRHSLVGSVGHDGQSGRRSTGEISIWSPEVMSFLTMLGRLIAVPAAFHYQAVFTGVAAGPDRPP